MNIFFKKISNKIKNIKSWHLLALFFIVNIFSLKNFPFIHSDEAWLSGLSRQIMHTRDLASTEGFFDLFPRHPHAIKIFFHLLQILFIKISGYQIFTFRLISLIFATFAAHLFYKLAYLITNSKLLALSSLLILLLDIHFIYSSHLARQEAILLFIFLAALYYFLKNEMSFQKIGPLKTKNIVSNSKNFVNKKITKDIILALILASAIGFHPNAFIISLPFILIYTYQLFSKKIRLKNYLSFALTLALAALLFIYISFQLDPNFINNYSSYGSRLGVLDSLLVKLENLKLFYLKLFYRISGTYYIPPIKFQLLFFAVVFLAALKKYFLKKDNLNFYLITSLTAINIGYLIIGRYNQTSIIFIFPISYLLFINLIKNINFKLKTSLIIALISILSLNTTAALIEDSHFNYDDYLQEISEVVNKNDRVLANLNADYYFNNNRLFDYRNLAYLEENKLSFKDYIQKNNIQYIIYPEEMDFIYNSRPSWNILYGNLYPYYSDMQKFLRKKTTLVKTFSNPSYAIRITNQIAKKNWQIKIYRVNQEFINTKTK